MHFCTMLFSLIISPPFSQAIKVSLLIQHLLCHGHLCKEKSGVILHSKAKVVYTFSPTEEKLNQQLSTKEKGNKG